MRDVRFTYTELYDVDEKAIDISSEENFVKSFEALGMVKIIN